MIAIRRVCKRTGLVDDAHAGLLRFDHHAFDLIQLGADLGMQRHGGLHGGLRMELRGEGNLEQHVFHNVAAERLRQRERLSLEEHVLEAHVLVDARDEVSHARPLSAKSWRARSHRQPRACAKPCSAQAEMRYPARRQTWGFQDVLFKGKPLALPQPFGSYVMENVLFKISFPAEFHAQTAVEAAMTLHPQISAKLDQIERVVIRNARARRAHHRQDRSACKPADRDHCIQYMVAIPLLFGRLAASDYEDQIANDPRVDALRSKMQVKENATFTKEYYDAEKRYIGNAVQIFFKDGTASPRIEVDYPIGHRKRRAEGTPVLVKKFEASVARTSTPSRPRRSRKRSPIRRRSRPCRSAISWPNWSAPRSPRGCKAPAQGRRRPRLRGAQTPLAAARGRNSTTKCRLGPVDAFMCTNLPIINRPAVILASAWGR